MKTQLDQFDELYLERLCEDDYLICWVRPMVRGRRNTAPSPNGERYRIEFRDSADYIVLQEITHAMLGVTFADGGHLSEVDSTDLLDFFSQREISPGTNTRNFALRTAHCVVHVFGVTPPEIFLESSDASQELLELIRNVSERPAMFAGRYDFDKAASFIDGVIYAREYPIKPGKPDTLWDFSRWLAEKLDRPRNWGWAATTRDAYKEDEKAFEMLPKHFEEFLNTRQPDAIP